MIAWSCQDQEFADINDEVKKVVDEAYLEHISPEMAKVRDYVPINVVVAHRGSTFWTPEETESAYRWAREIGADYLEADMQVTKDGVVLALHDDNLARTTNIEQVYHGQVPSTRLQYYLNIGYSQADAAAKYAADKKNFLPNYASYYTYEELLKLDAGTWFNTSSPNQARAGFTAHHQYISSLEDMVMYARGNKLKRDANGERIFSYGQKTGETVSGLSGAADVIKYTFEYEADNVDSGHRPGIYIEFKESWLNPSNFPEIVYNELTRLNMNVKEKPESENTPFYVNGKVNVGNTNGKVILQTFSLESLSGVATQFEGKVPMCFLFWLGNGATDLKYDTPLGYASFINLGIRNKAHIIGPCIAGAPNNYPEMNSPWQAYLIKKSGMLNHPYSFDTRDQMSQYYGDYNFGFDKGVYEPPYLDGMFTNRSEMTLQFYIDKGVRNTAASQVVPDPMALLDKLGYTK
ncbi:MAG: glycerophosphodiester phosphodiesterase [Prevotella sp.]|jgi:glycerophosphoryl diester phosphodiesterase|nr:glycerophosphodiester phosphodiesterase [Prevotella sp.]